MTLETNLSKLGFSKSEAQLYLTLTKYSSMSANELSKRTQINRRSVYDGIENLVYKGLVSYKIQEKKKIFSATKAHSIVALIDEQRELAKETQKQLEQITTKQVNEPNIEVFIGKKSIKGIFEELLEKKEIFYIYGGAMQARNFLKYFYPQWTNKRIQKGIKIKGIFIDTPEVRQFIKTLPLTQSKFITGKTLSPAFWWLKGDTVYIVFFQENPSIIKIKSTSLAKTYKHSFNIIWENLTN